MKSAGSKATTVPTDDIGWRRFPEFEKLLSAEEPPATLAKIEKTCRQLNALLQSGSDEEKARAARAMTAYGRSLDLLHLLTDMRDKAVQQANK
jgi:hypothetical protein